jgi:lincosamide nucleotidyltransferase A/C/D/E
MSRYLMSADSALRLLGGLEERHVDYCLGGGWGVDALLGEQTRDHSDLDLWLPAAHLERLFVAFSMAGVDRIFPWPGDRPWNFVLHDGHTLRVDLHLYELVPSGSVYYGSVLDGDTFPADAFTGRGCINGVSVPCEEPAWALRWRTGYPPRDVDRHDVPLLAARFGFALPEAFR